MSHPSQSIAVLRPDLGGAMEQFDLAAEQENYVGLMVAPVIEVNLQSSEFGIVPVAELLKEAETDRAPGTSYARGTGRFQKSSYATKEHGFEEPVDDREARIYRHFIEAEVLAAKRARATVLRNFEKRIAAMIFNTSTWTPTTVVNEWDDAPNATPIDDVTARKNAMFAATGLWPNALIINRLVFNNLRDCAQIIDRIKYVFRALPQDIGTAHLSAAFDLPKIIVAGGGKNTGAEGQTASVAPIWSNEYAAVARVAESNDIKEPAVARTFHWAEDGSSIGATMESYRDETARSDIIRARMDTDEKVIYTGALQLLDNITT